MGAREDLIADCSLAKNTLCDYSAIDAEITELQREIEVVVELSRKAIYEIARIVQARKPGECATTSIWIATVRATERIP